MFCSLCGQHARHPKSPVPDLRRKSCPRFPEGVIHRGCCANEVCSEVDGRGHVRCMWEQGGRERLALTLKTSHETPRVLRASGLRGLHSQEAAN